MTHKALAKADEILDETLDPDDEETYGPLLRAQTSVIGTVLTTQAKVDEHRLRRSTVDRLPDLLKMVNEIAAKIPQVVSPAPLVDVVPE